MNTMSSSSSNGPLIVSRPNKTDEPTKRNMISEVSRPHRRGPSYDFSSVMPPSPTPIESETDVSEMSTSSTVIQLIEYISQQKWSECTETVNKYPRIALTPCPELGNKTLLHILASSEDVPHNLLLMVISVGPKSVSATDDRNYLPLHYAIANGDNVETIRLLLECYRAGATKQGNDGNLPLHLAASMNENRIEETVKILLDAYPAGVTVENAKGKLPLHVACGNPCASVKSLEAILSRHSIQKKRPTQLDNEGNSPLHTAIKSNASYEIIGAFINDSFSFNYARLFLQRDSHDVLPLHMALNNTKVCPDVITKIIEAAPGAVQQSNPSEKRAIEIATERSMSPDVVRALLVADMPINVGFQRDTMKSSSAGSTAIIERKHCHSWWHVIVVCDDSEKYLDTVESILSQMATLPQVISLARVFGPDEKTRIIEAVSTKYFAMFSRLLRFYSRYELLATEPSDANDDFQTFHALDHDVSAEYLCLTNDGPCASDPFTMDSDDCNQKLKIANSSCDDQDDGGGVEVSLFDYTSRKDFEVILRCYYCEEAYLAELNVRERYSLLPLYVEPIYRHHHDPLYKNKSFGSGVLYCIAFEESDHTLADVFAKTAAGTRSSKWINKSAIVLKQIATALEHLHDQGVIHGHLDPQNISKFGNKWKLTNVGTVTPIGSTMRGPLRHCAPPESVSMVIQNANGTTTIVESADDAISSGDAAASSPTTTTMAALSSVSARVRFGQDVEIVETLESTSTTDDDKENNFGKRIEYEMRDDVGDTRFEGSSSEESRDGGGGGQREGRDDISDNTSQEERQQTEPSSSESRSTFRKSRKRMQPHAKAGHKTDIVKDVKPQFLKFTPQKCTAHPSWDIWSFGLLMVQLLLGRSVHLPNFEKADDALLCNLHAYNFDVVKKIHDQVRSAVGEPAADLVSKLLHPDPNLRPPSIGKVLRHKYFNLKRHQSSGSVATHPSKCSSGSNSC